MTFGGEKDRAGDRPGENRVQRACRAVDEDIDSRGFKLCIGKHDLDAFQHAEFRLGCRGQHLAAMAASGSFKHDVGERAPDISGKPVFTVLSHAAIPSLGFANFARANPPLPRYFSYEIIFRCSPSLSP